MSASFRTAPKVSPNRDCCGPKRGLGRDHSLSDELGYRKMRHAPHYGPFFVTARDKQGFPVARVLPNVLPVWIAVIERILKRQAAILGVVRAFPFECVAEAKALGFREIEHSCDGWLEGGHRLILVKASIRAGVQLRISRTRELLDRGLVDCFSKFASRPAIIPLRRRDAFLRLDEGLHVVERRPSF
jgi:hypothetical protein